MRAICSIFSFDYLDYDVFLNIRLFYRLSGYHIHLSSLTKATSLVVVLRGQPTRIFSEFTGVVHYYDYVREYSLDMREFFPNASCVYSVGLSNPVSLNVRDHYIHAYLPVFPSLWHSGLTHARRLSVPLHISNYKPIGNDPYQKELFLLIHQRKVLVYGGKWHTQNVQASQVSYLSANRLMSHASHCFGLMYPYQRGTSLSGRMWQAPINGCYVITESGTNIYNVPGVIEVDSYLKPFNFTLDQCMHLRTKASDFWTSQTIHLAYSLSLDLKFNNFPQEILVSRFLLFRQHFLFMFDQYIVPKMLHIRGSFAKFIRSL